MTITERLITSGEWLYANGSVILAIGMIIAFGYFCWTRSIKGMAITGLGLVTSLILGW